MGAQRQGRGRRCPAHRVPRAGLPDGQRLRAQAGIGECLRGLPSSQQRGAFGAVPDLQQLPQRGGTGRPRDRHPAGKARQGAGLPAAGTDPGSARALRALRRVTQR
ncbi:hypothetical protein G6F35_016519 [Rhizopus arrhizus]|nr:hypothetical protein G6F32_016801 [Rhizopus arrhizus]KAG1175958.1 hypothetical protein G6F35_016519 [Rhizopus arrhizus]